MGNEEILIGCASLLSLLSCMYVAVVGFVIWLRKKKKNKSGGGGGGGDTTGAAASMNGTYTGSSGTATGTSYNIYSSDNTCKGCRNEWKLPQDFPVNIVAVHERDWKNYQYKKVRITADGKSPIDFVVGDYCADKDCGGCCTRNAAKHGKPQPFLLDMDSRAVTKFWGIKKPEDSLFIPVQYQFGDKIDPNEWKKMGAKFDG